MVAPGLVELGGVNAGGSTGCSSGRGALGSAQAMLRSTHQNHETSTAVDRDGFHERQFATPRSLTVQSTTVGLSRSCQQAPGPYIGFEAFGLGWLTISRAVSACVGPFPAETLPGFWPVLDSL